MSDDKELPKVDQDTCQHCEHSSSIVHAVHVVGGYHKDTYCCKCGKTFCESVVATKPEEHGPFYRPAGFFGLLVALAILTSSCASVFFPPTRVDFQKGGSVVKSVETFGGISDYSQFGTFHYLSTQGRICETDCKDCTFVEIRHK